MTCFRLAASVAVLFSVASVHAQCDPQSVDFGDEPWGLSPDAETTFFDTAYVGLDYADEVHLLVPSFAIDVVPDTLNAGNRLRGDRGRRARRYAGWRHADL